MKKLYALYLETLAWSSALVLFAAHWKKGVIDKNEGHIGKIRLKRLSFYANLSRDFWAFLHGKYPGQFWLSPKSQARLTEMKSEGGLLLCAHFHNWELMGHWFVTHGVALKGYSQPLQNPWADKILRRLRKNISLPTISRRTPQCALKWIRTGNIFGILADQKSKRGRKIAPFFDKKVSFTPLPGFLQQKTSCPVFFAFPGPTGEIRLIKLCPDKPLEISTLARRYHQCLEIIIHRHPDYWYGWVHRRFDEVAHLRPPPYVSRETIRPGMEIF